MRLFITATDTGAGKTLATAALATLLRRRGRAVRAVKPVATGATPEDAVALARATGADVASVQGWSFREPAAPPVSARAEGRTLTLGEIVGWVRACESREPDAALLVEGVGGLLCPLTDEATIADLARELGYPVLIVARRGLGTLNHTLLTVEAGLRRGLNLVGVLISETQPMTTLAERTAPDELRRLLPVPVLGVLRYSESRAVERLADDLAGVVDALFGG